MTVFYTVMCLNRNKLAAKYFFKNKTKYKTIKTALIQKICFLVSLHTIKLSSYKLAVLRASSIQYLQQFSYKNPV